MKSDIIVLAPEYSGYSLVFLGGITGWEQSRGYRSHIYLKKNNVENWPLCFYDPVRLSQDLEIENYIAEYGLIVLNNTTIKNIVNTTKSLIENHYFINQRHFSSNEIENLFLNGY